MGFYLNVENNKIINASNEQKNSSTVKSYSVEEQVYYDYISNPDKYIVSNNKIEVDSTYETKLQQQRQATFEKEFFLTSLGYIRRNVSMATGETKDFLSDLLPTISMGVQLGQEVPIITYKQPDFTKEFTLEYMESLQETKNVTTQFIQECALQVSKDFLPNLTQIETEIET